MHMVCNTEHSNCAAEKIKYRAFQTDPHWKLGGFIAAGIRLARGLLSLYICGFAGYRFLYQSYITGEISLAHRWITGAW
jgi:hypothetical protein